MTAPVSVQVVEQATNVTISDGTPSKIVVTDHIADKVTVIEAKNQVTVVPEKTDVTVVFNGARGPIWANATDFDQTAILNLLHGAIDQGKLDGMLSLKIDETASGLVAAQENLAQAIADLATEGEKVDQIVIDVNELENTITQTVTSVDSTEEDVVALQSRMTQSEDDIVLAVAELTETTGNVNAAQIDIASNQVRMDVVESSTNTMSASMSLMQDSWAIRIQEDGEGGLYSTGAGMMLYPSWTLDTDYVAEIIDTAVASFVWYLGEVYECIVDHTSSSGILPTNASYWQLIPGGARSAFGMTVDSFYIKSAGYPNLIPFALSTRGGQPMIGMSGTVILDGTMYASALIAGEVITNSFKSRTWDDLQPGEAGWFFDTDTGVATMRNMDIIFSYDSLQDQPDIGGEARTELQSDIDDAALNSVWANITGSGKPADDADVTDYDAAQETAQSAIDEVERAVPSALLAGDAIGFTNGTYPNIKADSDFDTSYTPYNGSHIAVTYAEALAICEHIGCRLPTIKELLNDACVSSGAGGDNMRCWTQSKSNPGERWTAAGKFASLPSHPRESTPETDTCCLRAVMEISYDFQGEVAASPSMVTDAETAIKAYADAQDEVARLTQETYADGVATAAEAAALADAQAYADVKKAEMLSYTDGEISDMQNYVDAQFITATTHATDIAGLQGQIDNSITSWFYDGEPDINGEPAIAWQTEAELDAHLGDLYFDNITGFCYRLQRDSVPNYSWVRLKDSEIELALNNAAAAQDTADQKRRVFLAGEDPQPPYDAGDLWDVGGTPRILKRCSVTRTAGSYVSGDWFILANNTTDTAQLTDGASLGTTADWSGVSGSGKPADNADVTNYTSIEADAQSRVDIADVAIRAYANAQDEVYRLTQETYADGVATAAELAALADAQAYADVKKTEMITYTDTEVATEATRADGAAQTKADAAQANAEANAADDTTAQIRDIESGGTNLISNSRDMVGNSFLSGETYLNFAIAEMTVTEGYKDISFYTDEIADGTQHVGSFYAKADTATEMKCYWYSPNNTLTSESSTGQGYTGGDGAVNVTITSEWKRYWVRWTQAEGTTSVKRFLLRLLDVGTLYLAGIQLEKGNKATDWTPSPGDVEANTTAQIAPIIAVPAAPTISSITENVDATLNLTITPQSGDGATRYELYNSIGDETDYALIAVLPVDEFTPPDFVVRDATFDRKTTIYYKVFAVNRDMYSVASTDNFAVGYDIPDPGSVTVSTSLSDYTLNWVNPDNPLLNHVEIRVEARTTNTGFTEAAATLIYSGLGTSFTYQVPAGDLAKYHQFWLTSVEKS